MIQLLQKLSLIILVISSQSLDIVLDFYPETGLVKYTKGEDEPLLLKKL